MRHHVLLAVVVVFALTNLVALGQTLPTTREAEDTLKAQGLVKFGSVYLLDADARLQDDLEAVARARLQLSRSRRRRVDLQQAIQRAHNSARQWEQERADLNQQMRRTHDTRKYNDLGNEANLRIGWIKEADLAAIQLEKDLQATSDSPDDYITATLALSSKMEATQKKYDALAADESVKAALAKVNQDPTRKARLGPSGRFAQELLARRKERGTIESAVIKMKMDGGVPTTEVTLNGTRKQVMVVDSGAAIVTITMDVARDLGITPAADDPIVKLRVANGKDVEAKIVVLKSIQLAQFMVHDVECAIIPASAEEASCLLGGTFLRHFAYKMDLAAGALQMSQVRDPAQAGKAAPDKVDPK